MLGGRDSPFGPRDVVLALLVAISLSIGAVGATAGGATSGQTNPGLAADVDADSVVMYVTLRPDGTAEWRVEYRLRLEDDNDTAAFDSMREDVESNPASYRERFAEGIRQTVSDAENATGREMAARNFAVGTETRQLPTEYGIVYYTFEWMNFAAIDGETLRAGDALAGLFLDGETTLQMEWPEGYTLGEVAPEPTTTRLRAVSWTGSLNFASGEPLVVVGPASTTVPGGGQTTGSGTTSDGSTDGGTTSGETGDASGGLPSWLLPAVLVLALAAIPMAVWYTRRRDRRANQAVGSETESSQQAQPEVEGPDDLGGGPDSESGDGPDDGPPEELLSNEERVLKLLEDNGGRIKQQAVVETLGWTDAKTSQVVGALREDGEISVFRLGRENVLTLPDEEL